MEETEEITTLTTNLTYIINTVKVGETLPWFAYQLVKKSFIPHSITQGILDTRGIPPAEKAGQLMSSVFVQISGSLDRAYTRHRFDAFVDIFSHDRAYEELVKRLRKGGKNNERLMNLCYYIVMFHSIYIYIYIWQ